MRLHATHPPSLPSPFSPVQQGSSVCFARPLRLACFAVTLASVSLSFSTGAGPQRVARCRNPLPCHAAATTANFVCGQADLGRLTIRKAAEDAAAVIAMASATAIAELNVDCFASTLPPSPPPAPPPHPLPVTPHHPLHMSIEWHANQTGARVTIMVDLD